MSFPRWRRAWRLGLAVGLWAALTSALAQGEPARFEDSLAQRLLACTGCHGPQGRSAPDGYHPRIAGKPAGYLFHQLQHFRDGRRVYAPMARLLATMDDRYLREIAEHFAALDLPHPPPAPGPTRAEALARGERLALRGDSARGLPACAACHGPALGGVAPAVPGLLGLPRDYLNGQLGAWRTGSRRAHAPDCMADLARRLEPADIEAVAQWLAARPVPAGARPLASAAELPAPMPEACGAVARGESR